MTFSETPTFICKDRENVSFALKIFLGGPESGFDVKKMKKGLSVIVRGAERTVKDGKQGFVGVLGNELEVIDPFLLGRSLMLTFDE